MRDSTVYAGMSIGSAFLAGVSAAYISELTLLQKSGTKTVEGVPFVGEVSLPTTKFFAGATAVALLLIAVVYFNASKSSSRYDSR